MNESLIISRSRIIWMNLNTETLPSPKFPYSFNHRQHKLKEDDISSSEHKPQ